MKLRDLICDALINAIRVLPDDVKERLENAYRTESGKYGKIVLSSIMENLEVGRKTGLPLCQDTGLCWCLVEIGRDSEVLIQNLEEEIKAGSEKAFFDGYYRKSIVTDPIYKRENTNDNMPVIINYELVPGRDITLHFLLKGFGSENCSSVRMLNPTSGEEGVIGAVLDMVEKAGGKPCPPMFLGVGVGGTFDRAAFLSKKAFFKKGENTGLEKKILERINANGVGPGGLGGINTALDVRVIEEPTHIAGLPVALTVNCWCDRKVDILVFGGEL